MKSKFLTFLLILILVGAFIFLGNIFLSKPTSNNLVSPVGKNILQTVGLQKTTPPPAGGSTSTPIQYNFNKSTDLKRELDSINPEVLDSDFDSLKDTTFQL